ncbi:hypothetical protein FFK22_039950 [Mycobacterium sp. KBS0706]|nr:hypothetical protein FFK22_039950 [Mycobacterium sp. KBS0706]
MALLLPLRSEALHSNTLCPASGTHIGRATQFCDLPCPFLGSSHCDVGLTSLRWCGPGFPFGTLAINIVGSGLVGSVVGVFADLDIGHQKARLFLTTGIIGGFTTFSTFSLDAITLWQRGEHAAAIAYVLASISRRCAAPEWKESFNFFKSVAVSLGASVVAAQLVRRLA